MIDIHSHLLPKIDDGPNSWDDTMAMIHQADEDGIKEIAITHHILSNIDFEREEEIVAKYKELKARLKIEKIDIQLHLGAEIYCQMDMELFHTIATYNDNKKYFLVEFPMQGIPRFVADRFFELITTGMVPIVAHPERNMGIIQKPERAYEFVQRGALLQMNAGSILGHYGGKIKDTATILLNSNLIHFVGSDGHNTRRRPLKLKGAFDAVWRGWGEDRAESLFKGNPQKALAGDPVEIPEPQPVEPLRKGIFSPMKVIKKLFVQD